MGDRSEIKPPGAWLCSSIILLKGYYPQYWPPSPKAVVDLCNHLITVTAEKFLPPCFLFLQFHPRANQLQHLFAGL